MGHTIRTTLMSSDCSSSTGSSDTENEEQTAVQQRILILDDFEASSTVLKDSLRFCRSADCTVVASGEHALELLAEQGTFDLILSDVYMPGMNGIEFVRAVRAMEKAQQWRPQIIISMSAEEEKAAECLAAGSTLFLFKLDNPIKHIFRVLDELRRENIPTATTALSPPRRNSL